jgi:hypothetical protein
MGVYESSPTSVTDNDMGIVGITVTRSLKVLDNNSAAIAASLSVVDDWDESDRAKVNPIVGQAGVAAGAGAVAATVQRVTLASDDPGVTSLALIDDVVYVDDTATHATGTSKGVLFMGAAVPTDTSVSANDIGAVAMTTDRKLHVAVMDALPAGTAAIGKLAANSGVDIGDTDVTSVIPGTGATNLGKAIDTAAGLDRHRHRDARGAGRCPHHAVAC